MVPYKSGDQNFELFTLMEEAPRNQFKNKQKNQPGDKLNYYNARFSLRCVKNYCSIHEYPSFLPEEVVLIFCSLDDT